MTTHQRSDALQGHCRRPACSCLSRRTAGQEHALRALLSSCEARNCNWGIWPLSRIDRLYGAGKGSGSVLCSHSALGGGAVAVAGGSTCPLAPRPPFYGLPLSAAMPNVRVRAHDAGGAGRQAPDLPGRLHDGGCFSFCRRGPDPSKMPAPGARLAGGSGVAALDDGSAV